MKTIKQFIMLAFILSAFSLMAQNKVALHSNGVSSFFNGATPFSSAYSAAVDGDTIYLPGGTFAAPAQINKRVVIYGVGHHPDSSAVLGETIISGSFAIYPAASKSHFEGLKLTSGSFTYNGITDSVVIKRCYFTSLNFNNYASVGTQILENFINGNIAGTGSINTEIAYNVIKKSTTNVLSNFANQAWIHNNVIIGVGNYISYSHTFMFNSISDCLFDNNVIFNEGNHVNNVVSSSVANNTFLNNVFNGTPDLALNTGQNNYYGIVTSTVFTNYTGLTVSYLEDLHLISPTTYVGTTGNEVGIYGGFSPAKLGAIPVNPHFQFKNIATATNANGDLQIQIQVEAQNE